MKVVGQDANIIIDLEVSGLLETWLELPTETHTTDFIVQQLVVGQHHEALSQVRRGAIVEHRSSAEDLEAIDQLFQISGSGPDINDCSVLYLAEKLDAILLTGDSALKKECRSRAVEVHGTIWILEKLVEECAVTRQEAAAKLERFLNLGRFLPRAVCWQRIEGWRKQ